MSKTYYETLGVSQTASFEEIKRAFRVKAKDCHPDYHPEDPNAEAKFKEINEAYEVLKDEQKRAAYDRYGHDAFVNGMNGQGGFGQGFGGFDFGNGFENIFDEMFSAFGGRRRGQPETPRGADLRYNLEISLTEAYAGIKKNIEVENFVKCEKCGGRGGQNLSTCPTCGGSGHVRQRQGFFIIDTECPICHGTGKVVKDPCHDCKGTGRVRKKRTLEINVPAGVDTGVRMRLAGEGDAAMNGGEAGDLYVFVSVKEHPLFKRDLADLYCEVPIPMTTAALGGEIIVPTISGKDEVVKIKPGLQNGAEIRLSGKGMPKLKSKGYGDMILIFHVEIPVGLAAREKDMLREFEKIEVADYPGCRTFQKMVKNNR